jgi:hypothetical protein
VAHTSWIGALNKVEQELKRQGKKRQETKILGQLCAPTKKRAKLVRLDTISQPATRRSKKKESGSATRATNMHSAMQISNVEKNVVPRLEQGTSNLGHLGSCCTNQSGRSLLVSRDIPARGLIGLIRILIPTSCNFFFRKPITKNFKVKRAWLGAMSDRPGSPSRVRMSEDKVRRKDMCWSVGIFLGS